MNTDFQCELKLKKLNPHYSELVRDTAVVMANVLDKYTNYYISLLNNDFKVPFSLNSKSVLVIRTSSEL